MKTSPEVLAKRKEQAIDGAKAWAEYLAAPDVIAAKTALLRLQRIEKEEAAAEALRHKAAVTAASEKRVTALRARSGIKQASPPKRRKQPPALKLVG